MSMSTSKEIKIKAGHWRRVGTVAAWVVVLGALIFASGPQSAYADGISGTVTIDTSSLGQAGFSEIFFSMTNGNVPTSVTNTAVLSNFTFGTGGSGGTVDAPNTFGDVTAGPDLADGATMISDQFTSDFAGFFTAGSQISFDLNLSTNILAGGIPDNFSIYVVDPNGNLISTSDPTGFDSLLSINIDSTNPTVSTYSDAVTSSVAPMVPVAAPEPATIFLLSSGLVLGLLRKRASGPLLRPN
jgi:hypothetical protein